MDTLAEIVAAVQGGTALLNMVMGFMTAQKNGTDPTTVIPTVVAGLLAELGLVSTGGQANTVAELETLLKPISDTITGLIKLLTPIATPPAPPPNPAPAA